MAESEKTPELGLEAQLLTACYGGENDKVKELLKTGANIWCTDETGRSPLHFAAASGDVPTIQTILDAGIPWNVLDIGNYTAGDYAEQGEHTGAYECLVEAGVRAEMILRALRETKAEENKKREASNKEYLESKVEYSGDRLVDAEKNGVMMEWERPLMIEHAKVICSSPRKVVLNIGFGMGIIDEALQDLKPNKHVIVEAHPDVYKHMVDEGWDKKPGVHIVFGRWQDKLDEIRSLGPYDGIFFDTFGEFYQDVDDFQKAILSAGKEDDGTESKESEPILKKPDGIYSFFNGLGGDHKLFQDVYCRIVASDLSSLGVSIEFTTISTDSVLDPELWKGIKRPYWMLKQYNLPICKWKQTQLNSAKNF
ncbi:hypothetical protein H4219_001771 [Mycoemilia scoparia]|uniref:Arginine N-methyltransferase 2 n=1 Tax=Mycoemilia scoparia TaxID=417184 RepID=A0A9W8DRF9_9FUNG|nr:hypothetical protein H4219_001771 [Mycoemilia scoparia]